MAHFDIVKGTRIRARWFKTKLVSLAGAQTKFGADPLEVTGVVRHIRSERPNDYDNAMLFVDPEGQKFDGELTKLECKCDHEHVQVAPAWVNEILPDILTQEEALDFMWTSKSSWRYPGRATPFLLADLVEDTEMHVWNGKHPTEENTAVHTAKAGTTVLVSVFSRFGDVAIRDRDLNPGYGYDARVMPDRLTRWRHTL